MLLEGEKASKVVSKEFHRKWIYTKYRELSQSKRVALVQSDSGGTMNAYRRNGVQALLRIGYRRNSHRSVMIARC